MHTSVAVFVDSKMPFLGPVVKGGYVLEVGACDVSGSIRPIISEAFGPAEYIGVDIVPGPGVDKVCAAEDLVAVFGEDRFDCVISTEMLEHLLFGFVLGR